MPEPMILLRLFVAVPNQAEAEAEARRVTSALQEFGPEMREVEQYWKILENWEVAAYIRPTGPAVESWERLIGMAAAGWTLGEVREGEQDRWAVWNAQPGIEFLSPRAVWASVDLLPFGIDHPQEEPEFDDLDAPA